MVKAIVPILVMAFSVFATQTISLSGKVTKTGGTTGISAVKVSLAKLKTISTTSDADGAFIMSGTSGIRSPGREIPSFRFNIKDNCLIFSSGARNQSGNVALFSSDGKELFSICLKGHTQGRRTISLPELRSGINILRLTIGEATYTYSIFSYGNEKFLINGSSVANGSSNFSLMKRNAAIDTIIAAKAGYKTVKTAIDNYSKQDIAIQMDTSIQTGGGKCTREALQAAVDSYIAALEAADPTKMSLASGAKYIENFKASSMGEGIWKTKLKVNFHRDFLDVDSCKIYSEIVDNVSSTPYNIGAQITVVDGKIAEVNALVATVGDWLLKAAKDFTTLYTTTKGENWSIIPADKQDDRKTIQAAGDAYLDDFLDSTKVKVPWGIPCARLEGGAVTGSGPKSTCNIGIPQGLKITDRHYVIDVDLGTVDIFCKFGGGMPDSHLFRVEGGKLRFIHTISIQNK
jgi:hypothetical protein